MNTHRLICVAVCLSALFAIALPAEADTPQLSGTYAITITTLCQAQFSTSLVGGQSNNAVETIDTHNTGKIESATGTATFSGGQISGSTLGGKGDLTVIENNGAFQGNQFGIATESGGINGPYSNTATTLTLGGTTYNAAYGNIVNNVANYVTFLMVDTTKDCVEQGTAVHQ